ncbi:hypothetical protein EV363DRAFT_1355794 [Boletus edulis]|nr:hypothetical protein EV363DRAFT_1355794 [Boletus edulis]
MILRVYAMYNQSKIVLGVLLVMYVTQGVVLLVSAGIYTDSNFTTVVQLPDLMVCSILLSTQAWIIAVTIIQCIFGAVLCIFVVAKFVRDSLQIYRTSRKWQMNRYISLITRDGVFYFLVTLAVSLINVLFNFQSSITQGSGLLLSEIFVTVLLYTLTPRFVINVRELYVLDTQCHFGGDIDTGFGLTSRGRRGVGVSTTIGTMAFAEAGATGGLEEMAIVEGRAECSSWQAPQIGGSDVEEVPVCR